jgi:TRAP-type C4-dicarboxylate transport system permease small subunit
MKTWLALLGAPTIVLTCLSVNYALVTPACRLGGHALLDGVSGASFIVCTAATLLAWQRWRETRRSPAPSAGSTARPARAGFIAAVAAGVGALSVLSVIAISIPQWLLSAC